MSSIAMQIVVACWITVTDGGASGKISEMAIRADQVVAIVQWGEFSTIFLQGTHAKRTNETMEGILKKLAECGEKR